MKELVSISRNVSGNGDRTPAMVSKFGPRLSPAAVTMFKESAVLYKTARELFTKACEFAMAQLEEVRTNKYDRMKAIIELARPICYEYMSVQQFTAYAEIEKKSLLYHVDRVTAAALPATILAAAVDNVFEKEEEYQGINRNDAVRMEAKSIRDKAKTTIEPIPLELNAAFSVVSKLIRDYGRKKEREAWQVIVDHLELDRL